MNRLGLKISCFVVSILIWIQVASTSTVEQVAPLPLRVGVAGNDLTVAGSTIPSRVKVRVRGSKLRLLAHTFFKHYIGEVRVNLPDRMTDSLIVYPLSKTDVFSNELVAIAIQPPVTLDLRIDRKMRRMLPVRLRTKGTLPDDIGFLSPPSLVPDSVMVTGPARFFPASGKVATEPVTLDRRTSSGTQKVSLVLPHRDLKMASREVSVRFEVARIVERTLANLPVIPLVDADQPEIGLSPPVVDVTVRGVADSVSVLRGDRVLVTVPVGGLKPGVHVVAGEVSLPPSLTLVEMIPSEFQIVIGRVEPSRADSLRPGTEPPSE